MSRPRIHKLKGLSGEFKDFRISLKGFSEIPKFLPDNGRGFSGLKHILEILKSKSTKFKLVISKEDDSIRKVKNETVYTISSKSIRAFSSSLWNSKRDISLRNANSLLSNLFPGHFDASKSFFTYQKGMLKDILNSDSNRRLISKEDREALTAFIKQGKGLSQVIDYDSAFREAKSYQYIYLKALISTIEKETKNKHDEHFWQKFFSDNILFLQPNYVQKIDKLNIQVGSTQFPDFALKSIDGYLDILEIKRPDTELLKLDNSRGNYYWGIEISKAISQVENNIDNVTRLSDSIVLSIKDRYGFDLRIVKPRGIILAGSLKNYLANQKAVDDFRRLNSSLKNIEILPYDLFYERISNLLFNLDQIKETKRKTRKNGAG